MATPRTDLTGLNSPVALAFDSVGNLYVAGENANTVSVFAPGATTAFRTISGLTQPYALAFDGSGNLYVANIGGTTVSVFAPGATTAFRTLTGLTGPASLAFDGSGNLYVGNVGGTGDTVSVFAPGMTTPFHTLTGVSGPFSMAFDATGNLFVTDQFGTTIEKFAVGATTPTATLTAPGMNRPRGLAFDASGNLYVGNQNGTTISKFDSSGNALPSLTGVNGVVSLAFDSAGNLYAGNFFGTTVSRFAPGATTADLTLSGVDHPAALAFDSGGNLFVAQQYNSTVARFAVAASVTTALTIHRDSGADFDVELVTVDGAAPDAELVQPVVGQQFTVRVGSFVPALPAISDDFTATIDWGDGTSSPGIITPNGRGGFDVTGEHAYDTEETYSVSFSVTETASGAEYDADAGFAVALTGGQTSQLDTFTFVSLPPGGGQVTADTPDVSGTLTLPDGTPTGGTLSVGEFSASPGVPPPPALILQDAIPGTDTVKNNFYDIRVTGAVGAEQKLIEQLRFGTDGVVPFAVERIFFHPHCRQLLVGYTRRGLG